jgi:hypothetical protein
MEWLAAFADVLAATPPLPASWLYFANMPDRNRDDIWKFHFTDRHSQNDGEWPGCSQVIPRMVDTELAYLHERRLFADLILFHRSGFDDYAVAGVTILPTPSGPEQLLTPIVRGGQDSLTDAGLQARWQSPRQH